MNFTYVSGFVVLRDLVKVFPVSSSSFARKTIGESSTKSLGGMTRPKDEMGSSTEREENLITKWDLKLSFPSSTYFIRYLFI